MSRRVAARHRLAARAGPVGLAVAGAAVVIYAAAVLPPADTPLYPKCVLHQLTGLHCPGCGTARAAHAALNGEVRQAVAYNPLVPVVLPVVGVALARSVWTWAAGVPLRPARRRWPMRLLLVVVIAFGVLRNVPVYPFTLLAPHRLG